jgi:hypothetical protein
LSPAPIASRSRFAARGVERRHPPPRRPETPFELRLGYQGRWDDIRVGLQDTYIRRPYDTVRNDRVGEASLGLFSVKFWN